MQYLKNYGFSNSEIEWLNDNVTPAIKKELDLEEKLVSANLDYLKDLGVENYKEIFNSYCGMFLMDNSSFTEIFNKYDQNDLIDKLRKNVAIVEYL